MKKDLQLYLNYLYALRERELHGDKYGDTDEIIKMYEELLGIKPSKIENKNGICKIKSKGE